MEDMLATYVWQQEGRAADDPSEFLEFVGDEMDSYDLCPDDAQYLAGLVHALYAAAASETCRASCSPSPGM